MKTNAVTETKKSTEEEVVELLKKHDIDHVLTLPCGQLKSFLHIIPKEKQLVVTKESNGLGIAAGIYLGGKRPLMAIQNTGLGNMMVDIISLHQNYHLALPLLISWRGTVDENIAAQKPFGEITPMLLAAAKIPYYIVDKREDLFLVERTITQSFAEQRPIACLVKPSFWDKTIDVPLQTRYFEPEPENQKIIHRNLPAPTMARYDAIRALVTHVVEKDPEAMIVTNLGIPCKEAYAVSEEYDHQANIFYMLGSFGQVSSIGVGLAMTTDRNVYTIDGDGSLLHNPNVLDAAKTANRKNLTILCLDNGVYSSTGSQLSASNYIDLEQIALGYGFAAHNTSKVITKEQLDIKLNTPALGTRFLHLVLRSGNKKVNNVPLSCVEIKEQFQRKLLG